ncbi:MAG: tyrosine-type recombinase/integrase [Pseudomonadota bacterium]
MRRGVRHQVKLKHLSQSGRFASGNPRYYYRPKGRRGIPLPDAAIDDPAFLAAYAEAAGVTPRRPIRTGTLAAAIVAHKASDRFLALAAATRAQRGRILDRVSESFGHGLFKDLAERHVRKHLDAFAGHVANNRLKAWRGFLAWAVEARLIDDDPSEGIRKRRTPRSDGHVPWSAEDVDVFRERWPLETPQRLALELLHWTGARVSDAVRLGERNVDSEGFLAFTQTKTGGPAYVPFRRSLPPFAAETQADLDALHAALAVRPVRHVIFITTQAGAARSVKAVSGWFAAAARAAGLTDRTAHGLRKTRALALVYSGAIPQQVGAWTGHESLKEIERYTRGYDRRRVLSGDGTGTKSSNFPDQVPNRAEK